MGINFPDTPVLNQLYPIPITPGLPQYRWDGEKWVTATSIDMSGTVRYDTAQALTASQKAQARSNIDCLKKNYIINGAMQVSQENGATVGTTSGYYAADMFNYIFSNAGVQSFAQVASPAPSGSPNRLRVTVTTADASVGAGDFLFIGQTPEGLRVADLRLGSSAAKTFTVQFGVKAPAGTYSMSFTNGAANRTYVAEYVIAAGEANIDVVKSITLTGDTTGTWAVDNSAGVYIRWCLMVGTTNQLAAGAWGAGNLLGSPNQFNFMGTVNNVFELFDVGLYEGPVAPAFQVPDYPSELALCRRYYEKTGIVTTSSIATLMPTGFWTVEKRTTPSPFTWTVDVGTGATYSTVNSAPTKAFYQNAAHSQIATATITGNARL